MIIENKMKRRKIIIWFEKEFLTLALMVMPTCMPTLMLMLIPMPMLMLMTMSMPMPTPTPTLMPLPRSTGRRGTGGVGLVGSAGWAFVGAACAIVGYVAGVAVWVVVVV
jgi:hypothetical protein